MGHKNVSASYEEARKQRLEENSRRIEELGLSKLSKTLTGIFKRSPKSPTVKRSKPIVPIELLEQRRSSRIALLPAADYRDMPVDFPRFRRSLMRGGSIRRRCISEQAKDEAANVAENIETSHPSFVKRMQPSHVSSCFWLGLPTAFCKAHLPQSDEIMILDDEQGMEWQSIYLARKTGLSGGWRAFAADHDLEAGDAVLFELVAFNRFKIQIIRAGNYEVNHEETVELPANKGKKLKTA